MYCISSLLFPDIVIAVGLLIIFSFFKVTLGLTTFFSISLIISILIMVSAYFLSYGSESKRFDVSWGLSIAAITLFTFIYDGNFLPKKILITLLAIISSLRLSVYLFYRSDSIENPRYSFFKNKVISSLSLFLIQGVLAWLVSFPMIYVNSDLHGEIGLLSWIGLFFWIVGFVYESLADYQLNNFLRNKNNIGKVLKTGLWRYSRHPNYFGRVILGWGLWCFAALHFQSLISPVIMYLLIKKNWGIPSIEKSMIKNIPEYKDYVENTNLLVPWWPDDHWK